MAINSDTPYYCFSATLRIFGDLVPFEDLEDRLQLKATESYRKGSKRRLNSTPAEGDMWLYKVPVAEDQPLGKHIDALWSAIRPGKSFLLSLKEKCTVDIFLGYRSNSETAGFEIPYQSLEIFRELELPVGVSVIIA